MGKSLDNKMEGKLYAGGVIEFLDNVNDADPSLKLEVLDKIHELYELMAVPFAPLPLEKFNSYVLAHKMGLQSLCHERHESYTAIVAVESVLYHQE